MIGWSAVPANQQDRSGVSGSFLALTVIILADVLETDAYIAPLVECATNLLTHALFYVLYINL